MAHSEDPNKKSISDTLDRLIVLIEETNKANKTEINKIYTRLDKLESDIKQIKEENKNLNPQKNDIICNDISYDNINNSLDNEQLEESNISIDNKKGKKKARGKYKKTKDKNEFLRGIQYLEIKEGNKIWKYSISTYNKNSNTAYYYCNDTSCSGKGTYVLNNENKTEFEKKFNNNEFFYLTKDHSIDYEHHNYNINEKTIKDIYNYDINSIKIKLKDVKYLQVFIKKYAIKHNDRSTSASKLYNIFTEEFGNIKLDYSSISTEEKNKWLERYKKKKNLNDIENINIEDAINVKNFCVSGYIHLRNYREFDLEMHNNLINFKIDKKLLLLNWKFVLKGKINYINKKYMFY